MPVVGSPEHRPADHGPWLVSGSALALFSQHLLEHALVHGHVGDKLLEVLTLFLKPVEAAQFGNTETFTCARSVGEGSVP